MPPQRRYVLTALALFLFAIAGLVLHQVLGTVFIAITVAYLLVPAQRRLIERGVHEWWAAVAVTTGATLAALVPLAGVMYLLVARLSPVIGFLTDLPDTISVTQLGFSYTLAIADLVDPTVAAVRSLVISVASALPVLSLKATLFAIIVFALLLKHGAAERALIAPVPSRYHDVVETLARRARGTLYAIYVLQAATAIGTFFIALPVFYLLGYQFPLTLALLSAVLQFVPIVGPSMLIGVLAIWKIAIGDVTSALLLVVLGGFFIAWLPDILIRPRLSRRTAKLPGSLYFIGFTGGLLTVGPIGIVAGPLAIALALAAMDLLAKENGTRQTKLDTDGPDHDDTDAPPDNSDATVLD